MTEEIMKNKILYYYIFFAIFGIIVFLENKASINNLILQFLTRIFKILLCLCTERKI